MALTVPTHCLIERSDSPITVDNIFQSFDIAECETNESVKSRDSFKMQLYHLAGIRTTDKLDCDETLVEVFNILNSTLQKGYRKSKHSNQQDYYKLSDDGKSLLKSSNIFMAMVDKILSYIHQVASSMVKDKDDNKGFTAMILESTRESHNRVLIRSVVDCFEAKRREIQKIDEAFNI